MEASKHLKFLLTQWLQANAAATAFDWLQQKAALIEKEKEGVAVLNGAFAAVPRHTGTAVMPLSQKEWETFLRTQPPLFIEGWTVDRLARVWLLLHVDAGDKQTYITKIENLFRSASLNEAVALYAALPVLLYPEAWQHRCTEGIRSNMGTVLEALMCHNVYPSKYLTEKAWNQLVLKAFFTEKPVHQIVGLDARANKELATVLIDYAHERRAAGRPVNPQLWRCVAPFVDDSNFADIAQLAASENETEREAAALVCQQSAYPQCKDLLQQPSLQPYANRALSWQSIAQKAVTTV